MQENEQETTNALTDSNAENVTQVDETVESSEKVQPEESSNSEQQAQQQTSKSDDLPEPFKRRLGAQKRHYEKEIYALNQTIAALTSGNPTRSNEQKVTQETLNVEPGSVEEKIIKTLTHLAEAKSKKEREAEHQQEVNKLFADGQKYEDFEDVVKAPDVPITQDVLNAALDVPNSADVLYLLGKEYSENPHGSRLKKILQLPPQQLRRKMVELSVELMTPRQKEKAAVDTKRPMPPLKSNPTARTPSSVITENMTVSQIRKILKSQTK